MAGFETCQVRFLLDNWKDGSWSGKLPLQGGTAKSVTCGTQGNQYLERGTETRRGNGALRCGGLLSRELGVYPIP